MGQLVSCNCMNMGWEKTVEELQFCVTHLNYALFLLIVTLGRRIKMVKWVTEADQCCSPHLGPVSLCAGKRFLWSVPAFLQGLLRPLLKEWRNSWTREQSRQWHPLEEGRTEPQETADGAKLSLFFFLCSTVLVPWQTKDRHSDLLYCLVCDINWVCFAEICGKR